MKNASLTAIVEVPFSVKGSEPSAPIVESSSWLRISAQAFEEFDSQCLPAGSRILVVDDHELMLGGMEINLREAGYEVATARSFSEGAELAQSFQPDAILLDYDIPGHAFWPGVKRIRGSYPDALILVLTGLGESVDEQLADYSCLDLMHHGMRPLRGCIAKPASIKAILKALGYALACPQSWVTVFNE